MEKWREYFLDIVADLSLGLRDYFNLKLRLGLISGLLFIGGLWIIKAPHPIILGALLGLVDLVPLVGNGPVFLIWIILCLIEKNTSLALGLALVYILVGLIGQVLELKFLGDFSGLGPGYTLLASLLGGVFLGPLGVVLGPGLALLIRLVYVKVQEEGRKKQD